VEVKRLVCFLRSVMSIQLLPGRALNMLAESFDEASTRDIQSELDRTPSQLENDWNLEVMLPSIAKQKSTRSLLKWPCPPRSPPTLQSPPLETSVAHFSSRATVTVKFPHFNSLLAPSPLKPMYYRHHHQPQHRPFRQASPHFRGWL
jgi:hypothetical protein